MPHSSSLVDLLQTRVARDGARPLVTCYDLDDDSRVEFSARTFANWVDKTANLVTSLGLDEALDVALPVALTHPGHWVGLVWTMATWQLGGTVLLLPRDDLDRVELAVLGPDQAHPVPGVETVVCSLHPLGLGLGRPVAGVTDFAEVLSQPDVHWSAPKDDPIWLDDGDHRWDLASLHETNPLSGRGLLRVTKDSDPAGMIRLGLIAPLLGGGSVVIVRGGDADADLTDIAAQEMATVLG